MTDNDPTPPTMVKALFAIDPRTPDDVFEGWHNPAEDWNASMSPPSTMPTRSESSPGSPRTRPTTHPPRPPSGGTATTSS